MHTEQTELPLILAGPLLRRVTRQDLALWLVAREPLRLRLGIERSWPEQELTAPQLQILPVGERAYIHLIHLQIDLPPAQALTYTLAYQGEQHEDWQSLAQDMPDLFYPEERPSEDQAAVAFHVPEQVHEILHGSCRKPHHPDGDGLWAADELLGHRMAQGERGPDLLLMTGDQVYLDDLCGPMLWAIRQVVALLGLPLEHFEDAPVPDSQALLEVEYFLYGRRRYLPHILAENRLSRFFGRSSLPVFTSSACDNHLISFAEVLAMYLLVWSPALWECIRWPQARELASLSLAQRQLFQQELSILKRFIAGLPRVRRVLAHIPSYMIFDDHDVTDDWNLTAAWEQAAYGHPYSRRILGNALMGYWLCQAWGNAPQNFDAHFWEHVQNYCRDFSDSAQDRWIELLLRFEHWHYTLPTQPGILVLDTRTRRWRSERNLALPSGLMDWEALSEMQQELMHRDAVVLVSPAPIFGMKFVETLQWTLTQMGQALAVDAENWMAHPGAASTLMNIFTHARTPQNFVILSGDVHYSFAYDIVIRRRKHSPRIWQITASGLKNSFPKSMLKWFARANHLLYHRNSPLNWLTKRKRMLIEPRRVAQQHSLVNQSGIGQLCLNADGAPTRIALLTPGGRNFIFEPDDDSPIGPVRAGGAEQA